MNAPRKIGLKGNYNSLFFWQKYCCHIPRKDGSFNQENICSFFTKVIPRINKTLGFPNSLLKIVKINNRRGNKGSKTATQLIEANSVNSLKHDVESFKCFCVGNNTSFLVSELLGRKMKISSACRIIADWNLSLFISEVTTWLDLIFKPILKCTFNF